MKFTSVFTAVLALHLFVISILLIQPGCSTADQSSADATVFESAESTAAPMGESPSVYSAESSRSFNTVPASQQGLRPPSRPSWSSFDEPVSSTRVDASGVEILQPVTRPQQVESAPAAAPRMATYQVKRGDSLWKIARDHAVTLEALLDANQLQKDAIIRVGQEIRIPGEGGALPTAPVQQPEYASKSSVSVAQTTSRHKVQRGDTLSGLARQYGTSVAAIQAANGLSGTTIRLDQELIIPAAGSSAAAAQSAPAVAATQGGNTYVVKAGDTLDAIAKRHGVRSADLMRDNNISDPRRLRIGQTLVLREGADSKPAAATAPSATAKATAPAQETTPDSRNVVETQEVDQLPASPLAVPVNTVPQSVQPLDPLDGLEDIPIVATEESN